MLNKTGFWHTNEKANFVSIFMAIATEIIVLI
jgi:hypothetical protein